MKQTKAKSVIEHIGQEWAFLIPDEIDTVNDLNKMLLFRNRKRKNHEKVRKFFGSDLKIDISLNMIKKYKLPAILESDLPLIYFISYLIKYQGVENLFFILEVEKFKETELDSFELKKAVAQRIFATFMENGVPMQINTKKTVLEEARKKLKLSEDGSNFKSIFMEAYADIYSMLINVYNDFERSEFYTKMYNDLVIPESSDKVRDNLSIDSNDKDTDCLIANCHGSIYPMKAYYNALDWITYSVGCMEKVFDEQIASERVSINRNRQIRRMIVAFCEQRLKMDFYDSCLNLRQSLFAESDPVSPLDQRSSIISSISALSNSSQSNSVKRKDELDLF